VRLSIATRVAVLGVCSLGVGSVGWAQSGFGVSNVGPMAAFPAGLTP
jgi:hypothetical protein